MNINATLFGQMITFSIFIGVTMKYVWPPISQAMEERQKKIADGLAAGEQGERKLELSEHQAEEIIRDAKVQAAEMAKEATVRASRIIEEAKETARAEAQHIIEMARGDVEQERQRVREALMKEVAAIAVSGAEKIIKKNLDHAANSVLVDDMIEEIA